MNGVQAIYKNIENRVLIYCKDETETYITDIEHWDGNNLVSYGYKSDLEARFGITIDASSINQRTLAVKKIASTRDKKK